MTPDQLRSKVGELRVGGQAISEILHDDPGSLQLLQANATDLAVRMGVKALAKSEGTAADVASVKQELAQTTKNIADYQKTVEAHLDDLSTRLSGVEAATETANEKLVALQDAVTTNTGAVRALAQISYSGWTTSQKLQAVQSGLFPELEEKQKVALIDSLKADQAQENLISGLQTASQDLGKQQFAVVNKKLDKIIDLQVKTLKAIEALSEEQQRFRKEVLGQLDRVEDTVLI
jgi:hypothetical protein